MATFFCAREGDARGQTSHSYRSNDTPQPAPLRRPNTKLRALEKKLGTMGLEIKLGIPFRNLKLVAII